MIYNPQSRAQLFGIYAARVAWLTSKVAEIRAAGIPAEAEAPPAVPDDLPLSIHDGIGVIPIVGPMMKGWSWFADTDTLAVRRAVRMARESGQVDGLFLLVDSPGGSVAGVQALSDEVALTAKVKPVHAYYDDVAASAAIWASVPAHRVSAGRSTLVGSIGAFTVIADTSKMAEDLGIKVHVVQSGPNKAGWVDGVPVSEEVLAETQRLVDGLAGEFFASVSRGRGLKGKRLDAVTTGEVWMASEAFDLGLIDAVESQDVAVAELRKAIKARGTPARDRASARLRVAKGK